MRTSLRSLLKTPAFSAVAVITLGVGIAANTALFSIYDEIIGNPVRVPHPSSLVAIWANAPQANFRAPAVSWPRYVEIERQARSFSSIAVSAFDNFTLTAQDDPPDQLNGLRVSHGFFRTLGISLAHGRDFRKEDDVPNGPAVCVISDELWTSRFGRREWIVGETIRLNGQSWEVIGILPPRLTAPFGQVQVFAPRVFEVSGLSAQQIEAGAGYSQPIARLAPGVTLTHAASELQAISAASQRQFGSRLDANATSEPLDFVGALVGNLKPTFYTLLGAVGFVLLIACANVSSLFLGRLTGRQKEIAVRQALGASRGMIVRQFLTESVMFSVVAGVLGAVLSLWALSLARTAYATQLPPNATFSLNWRAWAFLAAIALASAVFVGLVPALLSSKPEVVNTLKDAARGTSSARGGRLRATLIVAEVTLSVVLLVGSGLLLVSFLALQRTPPGFDPSGVAAAFAGVPTSKYTTNARQADFFSAVIEELRAQPGVTDAAIALGLPVNGFGARAPYSVIGRPILPLPERPLAGLQIVSEDYFKLMRIPIREGRAFTADDREGAPGACIINQSLATRLFPGASPLGQTLARGRDANITHTIVGVIADVKSNGVNAPVPDEIYYPLRQLGRPNMTVIARTTGDPAALQSAIRTSVAKVDRDQPISFFQTLESTLAQSLGAQRIVASLTAAFAVIALLLAAVGLYSVVAYAVGQRTSEIGIRMALGARPGQVLGLIMGSGLRLVAAGLVLGLAGAAGTAQLIRTLLSNVHPLDPWVYGSAAVFFVGVSALACLVPSVRAARLDPLAALADRRPTGGR